MPTNSARSHRHFVAFPLLVAAVLVPTLHGALHASVSAPIAVTGSVPFHENASAVTFPDGLQVLLYDGAELLTDAQIPELQDGSALLAGAGLFSLSLGTDRTVRAIDGLVHVTRYDDNIVVAAITASTLVSFGDRHVVVPAGRQWRSEQHPPASADAGIALWLRSRNTQPVPASVLRDQVRAADLLPEPRQERPAATSIVLPDLSLLPGARIRNDEARRSQALADLRGAVDRGNVQEVVSLLQSGELAASLRAAETQRVLVALLIASADHAEIAAPLASALAGDPELWLLLTLHPHVSAVTGVFAEPLLTGDASLLDAFFLPAADVHLQAFGDLAMRQWGERTEDLLKEQADPLPFLEAFIENTDSVIRDMMQRGYPERAHRLAREALEITSGSVAALDPKSLALRARWQDLDAIQIAVPAREEQAQSSSSSSAPAGPVQAQETLTVPAEQVVSRAMQILGEAGALFTLKTEITAVSDTTVSVRGIVFSSPERDRTFDFTLNVEAATVHSITENGKTYLYAFPLQNFLPWVQQGQ
jgi:hypothetical protein